MAAPGGDSRGRQLRQRGSQRDQGQADHFLGHAEIPGDGDTAFHQKVRAEHHRGKAAQGHRPDHRPGPGQSGDVLGFLHVDVGGAPAPGLAAVGIAEEGDEDQQQDRPLNHADFPLPGETGEDQAAGEHHRAVVEEDSRLARHRAHQGGDPEDQQHVGDVAADHVADGDSRGAGERGIETDHQFRRRGAERHHGHADHQR